MRNTGKLILFFLFILSAVAVRAQQSDQQKPQCREKDYDCLIREYTRRIAADPKNSENYFQRSDNYLHKNKLNEAFGDYQKMIEPDPKDACAIFGRGSIYLYRANYSRAFAEFT
jgi:tetratricopeptide (TPR) repeat protein